MSNVKRSNNLSLINQGLKCRIMSIFAISSVIPILVAFYLNYDKVIDGSRRISVFLFIATILSLLGLFLLIDITKTVLKEN